MKKKMNHMYVWLIVVELVFFFFFGSFGIFLKEQVQLPPKFCQTKDLVPWLSFVSEFQRFLESET